MDFADVLSREDCLEVVRNKLGTREFVLQDWSVRRFSDKTVGLLADHFRLESTVLHGDVEVRIKFFIKTLPRNVPNQVELIKSVGAFDKEVLFYSKFVKELQRLGIIPCGHSDKESISTTEENEQNYWSCECYFTRPDTIVLQDLDALGFRVLDCRKVLDYDHCVLVLKTLARFHAASLILEEKQGEISGEMFRIGEEYPQMIFETFYLKKEGHPGIGLVKVSVEALTSLVKCLPQYANSDLIGVIEEKLARVLRRIVELVKPSREFRNVVCHSDLWLNNIMFRYGEDDRPEEAKLVDHQLVRYVPPTQDVFNFLHMATSRAFRDRYLQEMLAVYHGALRAELGLHGLDAERVLPWQDLRRSCKDQQDLGRINACHCLQVVLISSEALSPIMQSSELYQSVLLEHRSDFIRQQFREDDVYRRRITETLEEIIECCVLDTKGDDGVSGRSVKEENTVELGEEVGKCSALDREVN